MGTSANVTLGSVAYDVDVGGYVWVISALHEKAVHTCTFPNPSLCISDDDISIGGSTSISVTFTIEGWMPCGVRLREAVYRSHGKSETRPAHVLYILRSGKYVFRSAHVC